MDGRIVVAPLAMLVLKHGCDSYALARSREDMGTLAAMRETLAVLRSNGRRIVPHSAVLLSSHAQERADSP